MAYSGTVPKTAKGLAMLATPEEISKEDSYFNLASDIGLVITTDSGESLVPNTGDFGYTHMNLHRRIDDDPFNNSEREVDPTPGHYPFVYYDAEGHPYKQVVKLGVWDGVNSYRTTETLTHDEESTTCEIP